MTGLVGAALMLGVVAFVAKLLSDQLDAVDRKEEDLDDDDGDEGPVTGPCPTCGDEVDPDTGACERCLARLVRRQEGDAARRARVPEPDEEEEREVARLQAFLDAPHAPAALFCPACLAELAPDASACDECSKPALSVADVLEHVERSVQDITSDWFLPVLDDREGVFYEAVMEEVRADPKKPPLDYRIKNAYASWSGLHVAEVHSRNVPVLFLPRRELPRFRELLINAEWGKHFGTARGKLLERLDRLLRGRTTR